MALDDIGRSRVGKTGEFPVLYQELIDIFDETVIMLKTSLRNRKANASRSLSQSIVHVISQTSTGFRCQIKMNDYWQWVNDGRKAGKMPPLGPILEWMKFKGIVPRNKKGQRTATNERTLKSLAYAIAKSIAKKGTIKRFEYKGSNFYTDVIPSDKEYVKALTKRLAKAIKSDVLVQIKYFDK